MFETRNFAATALLLLADWFLKLLHCLCDIVNTDFSILVPGGDDWRALHGPNSVYGTSVGYSLNTHGGFSEQLVGFIGIHVAVFLVLFVGLDHVGPLHNVEFILVLFDLFTLAAGDHIDSHWVFVLLVAHGVGLLVHERMLWV